MDLIDRQAVIDEIDEWIKAFRENGHKESAADACLIQDGIIQLPSVQPEPITVNIDHELTQDDYEKLCKDMANAPIMLLPSAQPETIRCRDCRKYRSLGCPMGITVFDAPAPDGQERSDKE